jgi:hypothetical protein
VVFQIQWNCLSICFLRLTSAFGPTPTSVEVRVRVVAGGIADIRRRAEHASSVAIDPNRTSLPRETRTALSYVTRRSLRCSLLLRDDPFQPCDIFQQAVTGQDENVIAELRILKVDFKQLFIS